MKKQREILLNDFRRKLQDDDITKLVLMRRQENHKVIRHLFPIKHPQGFYIEFIFRTN
jgi:hypothetical protein